MRLATRLVAHVVVSGDTAAVSIGRDGGGGYGWS